MPPKKEGHDGAQAETKRFDAIEVLFESVAQAEACGKGGA